MKLQFSFRTSERRRRAFTLVEVLTATGVMVVVMGVLVSTLTLSGRVLQAITMQRDSDYDAVKALSWITSDVREANTITIVYPYQFRVYYPTKTANGQYYRFQIDASDYIEYVQADAVGNPSATGTYLWRRSANNAGRKIASSLKSLNVAQTAQRGLTLTLEMSKTEAGKTVTTKYSNRLLYLRNY